jgi:hypothetical protein
MPPILLTVIDAIPQIVIIGTVNHTVEGAIIDSQARPTLAFFPLEGLMFTPVSTCCVKDKDLAWIGKNGGLSPLSRGE